MSKYWWRFVQCIESWLLLGPITEPRADLELQHLLRPGDKVRVDTAWHTFLRVFEHSSTLILVERSDPLVTKPRPNGFAYRMRSDGAMITINLVVSFMACLVAVVGVIISLCR